MAKEKEDKFDKVETAVKKTTKIAVLIIGSIVTIVLTAMLAWNQLKGEVKQPENKQEVPQVVDTVKPRQMDTLKVIVPIKEEKNVHVKKVEPKEDILDRGERVVNKIDKLKKITEKY